MARAIWSTLAMAVLSAVAAADMTAEETEDMAPKPFAYDYGVVQPYQQATHAYGSSGYAAHGKHGYFALPYGYGFPGYGHAVYAGHPYGHHGSGHFVGLGRPYGHAGHGYHHQAPYSYTRYHGYPSGYAVHVKHPHGYIKHPHGYSYRPVARFGYGSTVVHPAGGASYHMEEKAEDAE
ncbi:abscisic acid and environmental stress-inducible protein-like [Pollicipes pollicipes]|uniref:abscisic acid and environmental stress-inducible protein-like n=1 Tax=Pollicipes pollicipes TaxID=41117 RepID=UPI001884AF07|nr:abscisic acid and environmental stress-inducible protein-like [Pollicipes pollicipes]